MIDYLICFFYFLFRNRQIRPELFEHNIENKISMTICRYIDCQFFMYLFFVFVFLLLLLFVCFVCCLFLFCFFVFVGHVDISYVDYPAYLISF